MDRLTDGTDTDWITPTEAANRLRVSDQSVRRWADTGKMACQRTPLGRLVSAADVARIALEREAAAQRG